MEYCGGKDMYDFLSCHKYVPEKYAARWFKQLLAAVGHLHRNGIAHRDIKIENILLDDNYNLKLTDFGYCCKLQYTDNRCCEQTHFNKATSLGRQEKRSYTPCGSYIYSSPELLRGELYLPTMNDVWACGIVFYIMLFQDYPEIKIDLVQVNESGRYHFQLPHNSNVSLEAIAILNNIFVIENKRYSIAQLEDENWVKNIVVDASIEKFRKLITSKRAAPLPRVQTLMFVPQIEDEDDETNLMDI